MREKKSYIYKRFSLWLILFVSMGATVLYAATIKLRAVHERRIVWESVCMWLYKYSGHIFVCVHPNVFRIHAQSNIVHTGTDKQVGAQHKQQRPTINRQQHNNSCEW